MTLILLLLENIEMKIDLTPLYANTVGFDRFGSLLDAALSADRQSATAVLQRDPSSVNLTLPITSRWLVLSWITVYLKSHFYVRFQRR